MRILPVLVVTCILLMHLPASGQTGNDEPEIPLFRCPLEQAIRHLDSTSLKLYGSEDLKLIISSLSDTTVKASIDGTISAVQRETDGSFEIVFNHEDFWFWISGLQQVLVRPQQRVSQGQVLGKLDVGSRLEILLFDFETAVDPAEYIPCFKKPAL